jgi:hypothetical protein
MLDQLKEKFLKHCLNDDVVSAQKVYDKNLIDINQIECEITTPLDIIDIFSLFECMCIKNHVEIVKWLITLDIKCKDYNLGFVSACAYDNRELAEHLHDESKCCDLDFNHAFMVCCFVGNFDMLKWLYSTFKVDIHVCDENPFLYAISQQYFGIARWLYDISVKENNNIDIRLDNDFAFRHSCYYGNVEMCKWLYKISGDKINKLDETYIQNATYSGNQELITWLET